MDGAGGPDLGLPVKLRESPSGRFVELTPTPPAITLYGEQIEDGTVLDVDTEVELSATVPPGRIVINAAASIAIADGSDETRLTLYVTVDGTVVANSKCATSDNSSDLSFDPWPSAAALTVTIDLPAAAEIKVVLNRSTGAGNPLPLKPEMLSWTGVHQAAT